MSMPMTRLEQETYEVICHFIPRIANALERIADALEHKEDTDGDNVPQARDE